MSKYAVLGVLMLGGCGGRVADDLATPVWWAAADASVGGSVSTTDASERAAEAGVDSTSSDAAACVASIAPAPDAAIDDAALPSLGFRVASSMLHARYGHASCVLADGRLLVVGGNASSGKPVSEVEVYDVHADAWSTLASSPDVGNALACAARAGAVVIVTTDGVRLLDLATRTFTSRAAPPNLTSATLMNDGRFLAITMPATSTLVYDPGPDVWRTTAPAPQPHASPEAAVLSDGRVAVVETQWPSRAVQIYDPKTDGWRAPIDLPFDQLRRPTALPDGRLLVFGGPQRVEGWANGFQPTPIALVGDDCASSEAAWLPRTANRVGAKVLSSGKLVVLADQVPLGSKYVGLNVTMIRDPLSGTTTVYSPRPSPYGGAAVMPSIDLLPGGQVVIVGGAPSCGSGCSLRGSNSVLVLDAPP